MTNKKKKTTKTSTKMNNYQKLFIFSIFYKINKNFIYRYDYFNI